MSSSVWPASRSSCMHSRSTTVKRAALPGRWLSAVANCASRSASCFAHDFPLTSRTNVASLMPNSSVNDDNRAPASLRSRIAVTCALVSRAPPLRLPWFSPYKPRSCRSLMFSTAVPGATWDGSTHAGVLQRCRTTMPRGTFRPEAMTASRCAVNRCGNSVVVPYPYLSSLPVQMRQPPSAGALLASRCESHAVASASPVPEQHEHAVRMGAHSGTVGRSPASIMGSTVRDPGPRPRACLSRALSNVSPADRWRGFKHGGRSQLWRTNGFSADSEPPNDRKESRCVSQV